MGYWNANFDKFEYNSSNRVIFDLKNLKRKAISSGTITTRKHFLKY